jgi:hypothetical protein
MVVFVLVWLPLVAHAQPTAPAASDPLDDRAISLALGAAKIGDDWFARLTLAMVLRFRDVTLAPGGALFDEPQQHDLRLLLSVPLAWMVYDGGVETEDRFRRQEWDEVSEYLRVLRIIEYGTPYDGLYFRLGELSNVRIGHRTIVDNYINTLDVDRFQWGIHHNLNSRYGGYEFLLDNVGDPELMGTRAYVRPVAFTNPESWWTRLATGVSVFGDVHAPTALTIQPDGRYVLDDKGSFIVDERRGTAIVGLDVELAAVQTDVVSVTPYSDANIHLGNGSGWHIGSFLGIQASESIVLDARSEFRVLGRGYLPTYFGTLYEVERFAYRAPGESPVQVPKLQWLRLGQEDRIREGYLAEAGINVGQWLRLAAAWENYRGPDNSTAWFYATVPASRYVQFGAYYANTRFQGARELFRAENALAMLETRVMLQDWLYVTGQVNRRWKLDPDGQYAPVDDFAVGVGASFGF